MPNKDTTKTYDQTRHKIHENWDDVRYLIALHNKLLARLEEINGKIDRLWQMVENIYEE